MNKLKAKKGNHTRISTSTIWTIAIVIVIVGVLGFMVWLQSTHH